MLLRNLSFLSTSSAAISAQGCLGRVRVELCSASGTSGVEVSQCTDVSLIRSHILGFGGAPQGSPPPVGGLRASSSLVVVDDCFIGGADGLDAEEAGLICIADPTDGTTGVVAFDSAVIWASGGTFRGGLEGFTIGTCSHATTAAAAHVSSGARIAFRSTSILGHQVTAGGTLVALDEVPRSLALGEWNPDGGPIEVSLQGAPGETVIGFLSDELGTRYLGDEVGPYQAPVVVPGGRFLLGTLDASGALEALIPSPAVGAGEASPVFLQAAFLGAGGSVRLAPVQSTLVFGPAAPVLLGGTIIRVDPGASAGGNGDTWATAFRELEPLLQRTWPADDKPLTFWLREGHYVPQGSGPGAQALFQLEPGTRLVGGFAGTETLESERDPIAHPTWIDGDVLGDDGPLLQNRADNRQRLVRARGTLARPVELVGLGFRGANNSVQPAVELSDEITVAECLFTDNVSDDALRIDQILPSVHAQVLNCTLEGNHGNTLTASSFAASRIDLAGLLLRGNISTRSVLTARAFTNSFVSISNATVVQNRVGRGAVDTFAQQPLGTSGLRIDNSIVWGNVNGGESSYESQFIHFGQTSPGSIFSSVVRDYIGNPAMTGTTGLDPLFVSENGPDGVPGTLDEDLRLNAGSPAVDSGNNARVLDALTLDLDGRPRRADDPGTPDTGQGTAPFVDRGAYER